MKKEIIAASVLVALIVVICLWMLTNWNQIKKDTLLRGPVGQNTKSTP